MSVVINGKTQVFCIVGDPIAQVKSPENLSAIFAERNENAIVIPSHVAAEDFVDFIENSKKMKNMGGFVITVPHKFAALELCDVVSDRAAFVGSVNIITRTPNGKWGGDNLDGIGYLDGIKKEGFDVSDKKALLVGAGGAGSAIAYEILARGARELHVFDADEQRLETLVKKLESKFPGRVAKGSNDPRGFDVVCNATPMGMREEDPLPVDVTGFSSNMFVADVITNPVVSPMVQVARDVGCNSMVGAGMFNAQAYLLVDVMQGKTIQ